MPDEREIDPSVWPIFLERLGHYVAARVPSGLRDDVVGEILLKLVQHRKELAATRDPFAWIMRIAANTVTDHHRRRASEQRAMIAYAAEASLSDGIEDMPSGKITASNDLAECVLPFIEQFPAPYRDALKSVEIGGLSQKEAASEHGLSVSGMKSRVQRARRKLQETILRCCAVQLDRRGGIMAYNSRGIAGTKRCCTGSTCP